MAHKNFVKRIYVVSLAQWFMTPSHLFITHQINNFLMLHHPIQNCARDWSTHRSKHNTSETVDLSTIDLIKHSLDCMSFTSFRFIHILCVWNEMWWLSVITTKSTDIQRFVHHSNGKFSLERFSILPRTMHHNKMP